MTTLAVFPYSCQTGTYTLAQLAGEACARCSRQLLPADRPRMFASVAEWTLYVHRSCRPAVTS